LFQQDSDSTPHQPLSTKCSKRQTSSLLGWSRRNNFLASAKSTVFAGGMFSVGFYKTSLRKESEFVSSARQNEQKFSGTHCFS